VGETRFGPYRLESLIGRGGTGEVHRAYDTVEDRTVALKLLAVGLTGEEGFPARFRRESGVVARLREPHVIPVHDFGEIDGRLFIDMRLVDGVDLGTVVERDGPLDATRAVHLIGQIAAALDAAHAEGLVHRDVKPSNVLVAGSGPDEFAYVIDFGIARTLLGTSATAGTLGYVAPERVADADGGDPRIDVYALGCLLHELLTGERPFPGEQAASLVHANLDTPPPRPSARRPGSPPEFDEVVARALAEDPDQRFRTAGELAAAARAVPSTSRAEPTASRSAPTRPDPDLPAVASPAPRRSRRLIAAAAVAVLVAAVAVGAILVRPTGSAPTAQIAPTTASAPTPPADPPALGTIAVGDEPVGAVVTADGTRALVTDLGSGEVSVVDIAARRQISRIDVGSSANGVALTPDGTRALVNDSRANNVLVLDAATLRVIATIPAGKFPCEVAVTADGALALVTDADSNMVSIIDLVTLRQTGTIAVGDNPCAVALTPDGTRALVANYEAATVSVVDLAAQQQIATIHVGSGPRWVSVTADGTRALVANRRSDTVSVIDIAAQRETARIAVGDEPFRVALLPGDARALVTNIAADSVSVIDIAARREIRTIPVGDAPRAVAVTPDGTRAVVTNYGADSVSLIDTEAR
jgi:serine/threonine-protein kinase